MISGVVRSEKAKSSAVDCRRGAPRAPDAAGGFQKRAGTKGDQDTFYGAQADDGETIDGSH